MQVDKLGISPEGCEVIAATDSAGPQVIAFTSDHSIHLLSRPLANHSAAVELGKQVAELGTAIYDEWTDIAKASIGQQLFAVFGGPFR